MDKKIQRTETSHNTDCSCEEKGCIVESVLTVDERGQMVLPKDVRERANIKPGDKLALISWEKKGGICCMTLIKVENLSTMVKGVLEPMMETSGKREEI